MNPNRYKQAFQEPGNLVGLAAIAAASVAMLNPLPLLVGLVAEAAYLLFAPDSPWYAARRARIEGADAGQQWQQTKQQTLPLLRVEMRQRFERLEQTRAQIAAQSQGQAEWFGDVLQKLDYLLGQFLSFARKDAEYRVYLQSTLDEARTGSRPGLRSSGGDPTAQAIAEIQASYDRDTDGVRGLLAKEQDENTKAVLEKRADVLSRRREYVGKIGKILTNLTYQLQLVEDTFGLINDEIRARSPEQVIAEIDDVVTQTDVMTKTLEEIAPYEQVAGHAA